MYRLENPQIKMVISIGVLAIGMLVLLGLTFTLPGQAAVVTIITVNSIDDTDDGFCDVAHCSLREAIHTANNAAGADTIEFALPISSTIVLSGTQQPPINDILTIDGSTAANLTVSGNNLSRVFEVSSGAVVTITALTIAHGNDVIGGGIGNNGILVISNSSFISNTARRGGGIYNGGGWVRIVNSIFNNNRANEFGYNSAYSYGGAIENSSTMIITNSNFSNNRAKADCWDKYDPCFSSTAGGAIINSGTLAIYNSAFDTNGADAGCNGLNCGSSASGGGIGNNGTMTINNSSFFDNAASAGGDSYGGAAGGGISNNGTINISNSNFNGNWVYVFSEFEGISSGGGISSSGIMTVSESIFIGNWSSWAYSMIPNNGGGLANDGTLTINDSTFHDNWTEGRGGGIDNNGDLAVSNSTIYSNTAELSGGGFRNRGYLTISNSTISGNSAGTRGGGIRNIDYLAISNSTFSDNSAGENGGGIYQSGNGMLHYSNTIIANSQSNGASGEDCVNRATIATNINNLVEDGSCEAIFYGDPLLGPLQDNGGPTWTHALLSPSLAIDHGDNAICATPPVNNLDQRGFLRPRDGDGNGSDICDIGAVEYDGPPANRTYLPSVIRN
jgi:CSLREA domain-containing protein